MVDNSKYLVLVSGATGYLASHVVRVALEAGYRVRGTVRSTKNAKKVEPIRQLDKWNRLELVEADLLKPETWPVAMQGVDFMLHVASPIPLQSDSETIRTAVDGTMNVLRAAAEAKSIKKVVLTSSGLAIFDGRISEGRVLDERDWGIPEKAMDDYSRSKIFAEKAAWEFWNGLPADSRFALTVINPSLILGPQIINEEGSSATMVKRMLEHGFPAVPAIQLAIVDVRDAALAHVRALSKPATDGQRILVTSVPSLWFKDVTKILAKEFEPQGYCLHSITAPYPLIWVASHFDEQAAMAKEGHGKELKVSNAKSKNLLDMEYRPMEKTVVEMAYSLIERGIAKRAPKYKGVPRGVVFV